jgi:hypothetical protein
MFLLRVKGKYADAAAVNHEICIVVLEESLQYMSVIDFAAIPLVQQPGYVCMAVLKTGGR